MTIHKYVNPATGIDDNDGSQLAPYQTLAKANTVAIPDTTIHLRGGTYAEHFEPNKIGTPSAPITWIAYTGETPHLAGQASTEIIMDVSGARYNIFDGLTFRWGYTNGPGGNKRVPVTRFVGSSTVGNTMRNCIVERLGYDDMATLFATGWAEWGIIVDGAVNTSLLGNIVRGVKIGVHIKGMDQNTLVQDNLIGPTASSGMVFGDSNSTFRNCLVYRNRIFGAYEEDGIQFHQAGTSTTDSSNWGTTIYFNDIWDCGENAIDLKGARYIVIDSNFMWMTYGSGAGPTLGWNRNSIGAIMRGANTVTKDNIIRNNVCFNASTFMRIRGDNQYIYNNTNLWNNFDYTGPDSVYVNAAIPTFAGICHQDGNLHAYVKNNISWGHKAADIAYRVSVDGGSTVESDYNIALVFADWNIGTTWTPYAIGPWNTLLAGKGWPGGDNHSFTPVNYAALHFVDVPAKPVGDRTDFDFNIQNTSVAYHAGGWLTKADGAGTANNQLKMINPGYFREDTFLKQGDVIFIAGQTRRITAINRTTRVCTLSALTTWANNDPIYYGTSATPNIGATPLADGVIESPPPSGGDPTGTGKVAVAIVQANTAGGIQNIPISGLARAPKAVEIICSAAIADGVADDGLSFSVGAMTATSQWSFSIRSRHGVTPSETRRRSVTDGVVSIINPTTTAVIAKAAYSSFSASNIAINWLITPPDGYYLLVKAYDCEQADARLSDSINGTINLNTAVPIGFLANVIRSASYNEDGPNNFNNGHYAWGTAAVNGGTTLVQNCYGWFDSNAQTAGAPSAQVLTGRICAEVNAAGAADWSVEVTSITSAGFNLTTRGGTPGTAEKLGLLSMRFATGVWTGVIDAPVAAASIPYTTGFRPGFVDFLASHLTAVNTGNSVGDAGAFGYGATSEVVKGSISVAEADGANPTNNQNLASTTEILNVPKDSGAAGIVADTIVFTTTGFELNWLTVPGTSVRKVIALAIQSVAVVAAEFSATPFADTVPLTVNFTDLSISANTTITGWAWDFGDGGTSTLQNPSHVYSTPGSYEVSLTVTDGTVSDTEDKVDYIVASPVLTNASISLDVGATVTRGGVISTTSAMMLSAISSIVYDTESAPIIVPTSSLVIPQDEGGLLMHAAMFLWLGWRKYVAGIPDNPSFGIQMSIDEGIVSFRFTEPAPGFDTTTFSYAFDKAVEIVATQEGPYNTELAAVIAAGDAVFPTTYPLTTEYHQEFVPTPADRACLFGFPRVHFYPFQIEGFSYAQSGVQDNLLDPDFAELVAAIAAMDLPASVTEVSYPILAVEA